MRKQILLSTLAAVIVAVLLLGVPLCGFAVNQLWATARANVDQSAQEYALVYDRNTLSGRYVTDVTLAGWLWPGTGQDARCLLYTSDAADE